MDTSSQGKNGSGLLHAVESLLSSIFIPALKSLDGGWGKLDSPSGIQIRTDFLNTLDSFVSVLVGKCVHTLGFLKYASAQKVNITMKKEKLFILFAVSDLKVKEKVVN